MKKTSLTESCTRNWMLLPTTCFIRWWIAYPGVVYCGVCQQMYKEEDFELWVNCDIMATLLVYWEYLQYTCIVHNGSWQKYKRSVAHSSVTGTLSEFDFSASPPRSDNHKKSLLHSIHKNLFSHTVPMQNVLCLQYFDVAVANQLLEDEVQLYLSDKKFSKHKREKRESNFINIPDFLLLSIHC